MGNKFTPIDAEGPRVLESGNVAWHWLLPWACRSCHRYGRVEVVLPRPDGRVGMDGRAPSSNDDIKEMVDRAHHHLSPFCIAGQRQRVVGRVYRLKNGWEKIYLRAKGETVAEIREQKWPPWEKER